MTSSEEEIEKLRKENEKLRNRVKKLEDEKEKIEEEFKEYKTRHPETVGIKNGKPYAISPNHHEARRKKLGAKPGHMGHYRALPDVDETCYLPVDSCPNCGSEDLSSIQEIRTRVIEDIPIVKKRAIKYRIARRYCRNCKKVVETSLKEALPKSRFSLRVMKLVAYMKAQLRIPIQLILKTLHVFFGLKVSEGEITNMISQMSKYYTPQYNDIRTGMREAPARNMDETSWREDGKSGYLWAFVTKDSAFFKIANTRRHDVPERILGRHKGVDIHDRYSGYNFLGKRNKQQLCWAHIIGDAKELSEFYGREGERIRNLIGEIYERAKAFDHKGTDEDVAMLFEMLATNLTKPYESSRCAKFVKNLLAKGEDQLFEFVRNPDVEPTNNRAERAIRPAVVMRKISGGTRSTKGSRRLETLLSVVQTYNMRNLDFLTAEPLVLRNFASEN